MCVANSARSQLAEALAKKTFGPKFRIESAGSQPSKVNPYAARSLLELGIDLSSHRSKAVADLPQDFVDSLNFVITLCAEEVCPVVLSGAVKLHWPFADPAGHPGTDAEQLARFRVTRDLIKEKIESFALEIRQKERK